MYSVVPLSKKRLDDYCVHAGETAVETVRSLARPLRGARVLNLSMSPFGTGVAELLGSVVPVLRDLGIEADWQVVRGDPEFVHTARLMYEGLSGRMVDWTPAAAQEWHRYNQLNAMLFDGSYDIVVVHDPQPLGLLTALEERGRASMGGRWVWHCHLDLRRAQPEVWQALLPSVRRYDAKVFPDKSFAPTDLPDPVIVAPAIDPTSVSNMDLPADVTNQIASRHGVDPSRPLMVQVGPLEPSFGAIQTIDIYCRAKVHRRDLQLLLINPIAETSLEAWALFERVVRHARGDSDVHVLVGQGDVGHLAVNAAQRAASVVVQYSVPAGFWPPLWEAQWKGRPVVAGLAGGLPFQVVDGLTGYLATDDDAFVEAVLELVSDPARSTLLGAAGRDLVLEHHLITRFLMDQLRLFHSLLSYTAAGTAKGGPTRV